MALTERLIVKVDAVTGGAIRDMRALSAESAKLGAATQATNAQASKGRAAWGQYGPAVKMAGVGVAAVGVLAFKAASEFADLGTEVRKFRDIAGVSSETASRWVAVMDDFGIASSTGARGMRQLATETNTGGQKLREFGVQVAYAKDGTVDLQGTVLNVADAYKDMNDPAAKAELLAAAFGKRVGTELIPILEKGSAGVRKLFAGVAEGQILDDEDLERAREFKLAMDDLNDAAKELVISFGAVAAGPLSTIASGLAMLTRGITDVNDATNGVALGPLGFGMQALEANTGSLADALEQRLLKELANTEVGSRRYNQILDELKSAHEDAIPPTGKLAEGTRRFGAALQAETAGIKATTAALYEKINAELAAEGSVLAVESAQRSYNEALYLHGPNSLEARQAMLNLEAAAVRATQASKGNKQAQQELAFILSGLPPKVQALITKLLNIPSPKPKVTLDTSDAQRKFDKFIRDNTGKVIGVHITGSSAGGKQFRQFGGPVAAGSPYVVGEAGPEVFVPNASGTIVPNHHLSSGGGRMAGGTTIVIHQHIAGAVRAERELVNVALEGFRKKLRQSGSLGLN